MIIFKIIACGLICAVLSQLFNQQKEIQSLLLISGVLICGFMIIDEASDYIFEIEDLISSVDINCSYIGLSVKCIAIIYASELSSNICKDSGNSSLASIIDISCRATITLICFPMYKDLIGYIKRILEI